MSLSSGKQSASRQRPQQRPQPGPTTPQTGCQWTHRETPRTECPSKQWPEQGRRSLPIRATTVGKLDIPADGAGHGPKPEGPREGPRGRLQSRGPPPPPRQERNREEDRPRQVQQVTINTFLFCELNSFLRLDEIRIAFFGRFLITWTCRE